jgi:hypothetical protein
MAVAGERLRARVGRVVLMFGKGDLLAATATERARGAAVPRVGRGRRRKRSRGRASVAKFIMVAVV